MKKFIFVLLFILVSGFAYGEALPDLSLDDIGIEIPLDDDYFDLEITRHQLHSTWKVILRGDNKIQRIISIYEEYPKHSIYLGSALLVYWIVMCYALMLIAIKLGSSKAWMAWFPVFNIFLLIDLADKPITWFVLAMIPYVTPLVIILLWRDIADFLHQPKWLGLFMIVPGINVILIWYLALSEEAHFYGEAYNRRETGDKDNEVDRRRRHLPIERDRRKRNRRRNRQ